MIDEIKIIGLEFNSNINNQESALETVVEQALEHTDDSTNKLFILEVGDISMKLDEIASKMNAIKSCINNLGMTPSNVIMVPGGLIKSIKEVQIVRK